MTLPSLLILKLVIRLKETRRSKTLFVQAIDILLYNLHRQTPAKELLELRKRAFTTMEP